MILIIAYGNSLRRDDGAGLILGQMLETALRGRGFEVEFLAMHQLTPDVALAVAADAVAAVIFVDTRVTEPGEGQGELLLNPLLGAQDAPSLGHQVGAATIMTYAHLLYEKSPLAWLLTVPGVDFAHGEGLSVFTQKAVDSLPDLLAQFPSQWPLGDG